MSTFQAVAITRLYRVIADQIAGRIRAGEFPRGGRLPSERELAEQLQVSRASIREALIALEIEGYVEVRVGTGVFVTREGAGFPAGSGACAGVEQEHDDIGPFDLLEARMLIEPECAGMAAQQASPAQIAAIRQTLASNDPQGYLTTYELFATQDMYRADDLGSIQAPTLVATGELDPGSTPEMARQLAARIPGAQVAILDEQRHMMPVESPRLVNQVLLDFLHQALSLPNQTKGIVA